MTRRGIIVLISDLYDEPKLVNDPLRESRVAIAEMRAKYLTTT